MRYGTETPDEVLVKDGDAQESLQIFDRPVCDGCPPVLVYGHAVRADDVAQERDGALVELALLPLHV